MAKGDVIIDMKNIIKRYFIGQPNELEVLHGIDMKVHEGEFVAIMGTSGSGKSTCMNMIGCLDRPTSGIVEINGKETAKMTEKELALLRNRTVGFVFQQYHLIPSMNILENVMLPLKYQKIEKSKRVILAKEALEAVGLSERLKHRPHELSGGQKQRVAIARAMVTNPKILLADEPTGALDSSTGKQVMEMFRKINSEKGTTVIIVTHDPGIGQSTKRCIKILDGNIVEE